MQFANILLTATACTVALAGGTEAKAQNNYFFGDSDLEQGNLPALLDIPLMENPPYYCEGGHCRDSNGPVWTELVSDGSHPAMADDRSTGSLNFAVSGARAAGSDPMLPIRIDVGAQIGWFAQRQDMGAIQIKSSDRFFIHAGANDLQRLGLGDEPEAISADIAGAIANHVSTLAERGARTIVVAEVQPVQYLPLLNRTDSAADIGRIVAAANDALSTALAAQKASLPPGTNLIQMRQTAFFETVRRNARALGFANIAEPCFDSEADDGAGLLCSPTVTGQNRYLFFDPNHLSAAGQRLMAQWYQATLDGASGEAARGVGRLPDLLTEQRERLTSATLKAASSMSRGESGVYLAPTTFETRLGGIVTARMRTRGMSGGLQIAVGGTGFAAITGDYMRGKASVDGAVTATMDNWSAGGLLGLHVGAVRIMGHGSYSQSTLSRISRETGMPTVVATGRTQGRIFEGGAAIQGAIGIEVIRLAFNGRLTYRHVTLQGFTEQDADGLALEFDRQRFGRLTGEANVTMSTMLAGFVRPQVGLAYRELLAGTHHMVVSQLVDNLADTAKTSVAFGGRRRLETLAGVDVTLSERLRFSAVHRRGLAGPERRSSAWMITAAIIF